MLFCKKKRTSSIEPACEICLLGRASCDKQHILCRWAGVVAPDHQCKKFRYDPLKRIPHRPPSLPHFSYEDFSLEV